MLFLRSRALTLSSRVACMPAALVVGVFGSYNSAQCLIGV